MSNESQKKSIKYSQNREYFHFLYYLCNVIENEMLVLFDKDYLCKLYETESSEDKKHQFQPQIIRKYIRVVDLMISVPNVLSLMKYHSLHYEKLSGNKVGLSSVRINNQYRIEFEERKNENETIATICNIVELSNHYK